MKRFIALALALVLCLSLLAGCETKPVETQPQETEPVAQAPLTNAERYPLQSDKTFDIVAGSDFLILVFKTIIFGFVFAIIILKMIGFFGKTSAFWWMVKNQQKLGRKFFMLLHIVDIVFFRLKKRGESVSKNLIFSHKIGVFRGFIRYARQMGGITYKHNMLC